MAKVYSSRPTKRRRWWETNLQGADVDGRGESASQRTKGKSLISGLDILRVRAQADQALRKVHKPRSERAL